LFVAGAVLYNSNTPLYEAPDELQHAALVAWLADGQGLPVVDRDNLGPWEQEGTQPPLYYWIAAKLLGWMPHESAISLAELNPYASVGDPQRPDNKNRVLHDLELERWPYRGGVMFAHLVRGLSTLMAAGTLGAIYCLGRMVFPEREGLSLGMVGLVAFTPQFLFLSASINNDNLVILIASWVLVLLTRLLRSSRLPGWLSLLGLGILLGLAVLAKYSGLLLWPLSALTICWLAWREKRPGWLIQAGLLVLGVALAFCGWWFARNYRLYGELSGIGTHLAIMGTRRRLPSLANVGREFNGFRYSFWALFGWFNILVPDPFYWIVDGLTALGIAGGSLFWIRSMRRLSGWVRRVLAMQVVWLALVLAAVVLWTIRTPASQGRLLYPALAAIALFLVLGWAELIPRRLRWPTGVVALVAWVGWAMLCPFLFISPAYALPERVDSLEQLATEYSPLQVRYGTCCELVGYQVSGAPGDDQVVYPGERIPLTLVWRAIQTPEQDHALFVHAMVGGGQLAGQLDTYHGGGMYPTGQWRPGEIIVDTVHVPLSWQAEGPALVRFNVGLHQEAGRPERLPAFTPDGQEVETVFAGEIALEPFVWPEPRPGPYPDAVFGGQIRLVGAELSQVTVHPGDRVTITLWWEALAGIAEDYTGFVHLVNPAKGDVAQDDHIPLDGRYPTRLWRLGTVVADPYQIQLPMDLDGGTYDLVGGFYRSGTGERLQAVSRETGERWEHDLVRLGEIVVAKVGQ
jgi:4-amino-4-deoxy-L-arabinose transferase-like glycosyltransferase